MRLGFGLEFRQGSKHNKVRRDMRRRQNAKDYELTGLYIKYMQREGEKNIKYDQEKAGKNTYVKIRNRCIYTGKARGVYKSYKMSRVSFRELCINGDIPGFRKASW